MSSAAACAAADPALTNVSGRPFSASVLELTDPEASLLLSSRVTLDKGAAQRARFSAVAEGGATAVAEGGGGATAAAKDGAAAVAEGVTAAAGEGGAAADICVKLTVLGGVAGALDAAMGAVGGAAGIAAEEALDGSPSDAAPAKQNLLLDRSFSADWLQSHHQNGFTTCV